VTRPIETPVAVVPLDPRVPAAAAGDRHSAHALLTELLPRVRNLVRYLVRHDDEVDEIAQLVLLELLRSFRTYRASGSLTAWCDRITARVAIAQARRRRRWLSWHVTLTPELHAIRSPDAQPDEYLARRRAMRALDGLPVEQRFAVVMHHVAGFTVPEIAEELRISPETVRSRLRLGVGRLRQQIQQAEGKSP
jgi:RNA polymerase sigma-70 factor, ECF subfamily